MQSMIHSNFKQKEISQILLKPTFQSILTIRRGFSKVWFFAPPPRILYPLKVGSNRVKGHVKVSDHCHIIGKCKVSSHNDFNIKVKLNHKILILFRKLKNYDPNLVM